MKSLAWRRFATVLRSIFIFIETKQAEQSAEAPVRKTIGSLCMGTRREKGPLNDLAFFLIAQREDYKR